MLFLETLQPANVLGDLTQLPLIPLDCERQHLETTHKSWKQSVITILDSDPAQPNAQDSPWLTVLTRTEHIPFDL